jgi:hypothetical protein
VFTAAEEMSSCGSAAAKLGESKAVVAAKAPSSVVREVNFIGTLPPVRIGG